MLHSWITITSKEKTKKQQLRRQQQQQESAWKRMYKQFSQPLLLRYVDLSIETKLILDKSVGVALIREVSISTNPKSTE
jgi:hypothetical protein